MNIIEKLEKQQIEKLGKEIPEFGAGDTLRVHVKVSEGNRDRIQVFEGICIARANDSVNSSFTVRKISFGEGVERVFPLYSPIIDKIEVMRRGAVRRAKLYYLRGRTGKAARIAEKDNLRSLKKDPKASTAKSAPKADDSAKETSAKESKQEAVAAAQ